MIFKVLYFIRVGNKFIVDYKKSAFGFVLRFFCKIYCFLNEICMYFWVLVNLGNIKFVDDCLNRKVSEFFSMFFMFVVLSKMGICLEYVLGMNFKRFGRNFKWRGIWIFIV